MRAPANTPQTPQENIASGPPISAHPAITPICLCCFGRGGSSLGWHLIGSASNVLMMNEEWHEAVFTDPISQMAHRAFLMGHRRGVPIAPGALQQALPIRQLMKNRTLAAIDPQEWREKPQAPYLSLKLMGYHMDLAPLIRAAFGQMHIVVMSRGPEAQIESLQRTNHTLQSACKWYADIIHRMEAMAHQEGALHFRFEDFLADPAGLIKKLYDRLGLTQPASGLAKLKSKPFGEARGAQIDVRNGSKMQVPFDQLADTLDASVNEKAINRLSTEQRAYIAQSLESSGAKAAYDRLVQSSATLR